jgi:hypothetical protein
MQTAPWQPPGRFSRLSPSGPTCYPPQSSEEIGTDDSSLCRLSIRRNAKFAVTFVLNVDFPCS